VAISTYLGHTDRFDQAVASFSEAYANQTERDYERVMQAIAHGTLQVEIGV
jgi:hypothetical protein